MSTSEETAIKYIDTNAIEKILTADFEAKFPTLKVKEVIFDLDCTNEFLYGAKIKFYLPTGDEINECPSCGSTNFP